MADLCRELGISRSRLYRLVKDHRDLSPSLYIRQKRLVKAQSLLEQTDWRVAEIAYKVGLDSPQTLTKHFTQAFGLSPAYYRRQYKTDPPGDDVPHRTPSVPVDEVSGQRWKYLPVLVALGLLALGAFGYRRFLASTPRASADSFSNSVAILPFLGAGADTTSLLADGLAGQLYGFLSAVENLKVISRNSAELFRDTRKPIPQIAAELHVNYVLIGRIKQASHPIQ